VNCLQLFIDDCPEWLLHFQSAWETNKKEAEQKAAFYALLESGVLEQPAIKEDE
jgi:hypothetical protein